VNKRSFKENVRDFIIGMKEEYEEVWEKRPATLVWTATIFFVLGLLL